MPLLGRAGQLAWKVGDGFHGSSSGRELWIGSAFE
jgi:hypothetical protein